MKPKFELHDRVRHTDSGLVGMVISIDADHKSYYVCYDDDFDEYYVDEADIEFENPKLTFLTRLQELLGTFDAKITGGGFDGYGDYLKCSLGQDESFDLGQKSRYDDRPNVNADNVFDYEKD